MNNILLINKFSINKKKFTFIICFLLIIFCFLIISYFYEQIKTPLSKDEIEQTIIIERGKRIKEIAKELEEANLIRGSFYFQFYTFLRNKRNLQAGEYLLSPSMSISQIVETLSFGKVVRHEVKITIPEGFTVKQIDARLVEAGLIQPGELISFNVKNLVPLSPEATPRRVDSQFLVSSLEGYLFPDTYIFTKEVSLEEIIKRINDNFNKKLTEQIREEIKRQNKTIGQIIILASIIQQEAFSNQEMPKLAGIFYNRLEIGMPLQSDVTVNYVTGKKLRQPTIEDTKIDSPYNTYLYKGLPPSPISNPGIDAIKAAIWPEKTDYLYFLHPLNGPTIFSRTQEEHIGNKAEWLR